MTQDLKRIAETINGLLMARSFRLILRSHEAIFVRHAGDEIFERIHVTLGFQRDANKTFAGANGELAVVPGITAVKGLAVSEHIALPSSDEQGWTDVSTESRVFDFAQQVYAHAEKALTDLSGQHRLSLLGSTEALRRACKSYLTLIPERQSHSDYVQRASSLASKAQREAIDRWVSERVVLIPQGELFYRAASFLIVLNVHHVEPSFTDTVLTSVHAKCDRAIALRLHVLASRLSNETGWLRLDDTEAGVGSSTASS